MNKIPLFLTMISLCVFLFLTFKQIRNSDSSKTLLSICISWSLYLLIHVIYLFVHIDFPLIKLLAFAVGFVTSITLVDLTIVKSATRNLKRESALKKIPFLAGFVFLTLVGELGLTAFKWIHWISHLTILLIIFMNKQYLVFRYYAISCVILTFFYYFEKSIGFISFFPITFSIIIIFVTISLKKVKTKIDEI